MTSTANSLQRAWWLKTLHQWHWISAAISLVGLLLFSVTGITLNHAASIEASPRITSLERTLPESLQAELTTLAAMHDEAPPAPPALRSWIAREFSVDIRGRELEWAPDELYVALPRPGGDAWLQIDLDNATAVHEMTSRGWISYLNDLHKGRHAGTAWSWFIDLFAVACLLFAITGLLILKLHAKNRAATWPLVAAGLLLPLLLAILTIH